MRVQVFCDLDGVLADIDEAFFRLQGWRPSVDTGRTIDWESVPLDFYDTVPVMADARMLWHGLRHLDPIVLTGVGSRGDPAGVSRRKIRWVKANIDPQATTICCRPSEKSMWMKPGDIIIDDWPKYRHLWEEKGGRWILHTSAMDSLKQLAIMLYG